MGYQLSYNLALRVITYLHFLESSSFKILSIYNTALKKHILHVVTPLNGRFSIARNLGCYL